MELGWETDLSRVLLQKSIALVRRDLGGGELPGHYLNAVLKHMALRHYVRGDKDGRLVVMSAEEFIGYQRRGESHGLENAELYTISARTLRTMLNERGAAGLPTFSENALDIDFKNIQSWSPTSTALEPMVARVPAMTSREMGDRPVGQLRVGRAFIDRLGRQCRRRTGRGAGPQVDRFARLRQSAGQWAARRGRGCLGIGSGGDGGCRACPEQCTPVHPHGSAS